MASVSDDLVLWHALYGLEVRYWYEVDCNDGANAHSFYTADGVFAVGENEFLGRERIEQFYAWRGRRGMETVRSLRTTRHLINNLWVEATGEREAKAFGVISFHDGPGRAPVRASNPPVMSPTFSTSARSMTTGLGASSRIGCGPCSWAPRCRFLSRSISAADAEEPLARGDRVRARLERIRRSGRFHRAQRVGQTSA